MVECPYCREEFDTKEIMQSVTAKDETKFYCPNCKEELFDILK